MAYLAGVDGGGSKTRCIIGNGSGSTLSEGFSIGSNYQLMGEKGAEAAIREAITHATAKIGITNADIDYTVFGLCGADGEQDFTSLHELCRRVLGHGRFSLHNDAWIALRAGATENWGVVTICGSGGACAGRNKSGDEVILRNLSYELGNVGGGMDIARRALHCAFRSEEKTGEPTRLEAEIPKLFKKQRMSEIVHVVTAAMPEALSKRTEEDENNTASQRGLTRDDYMAVLYDFPLLVCRLANEGDRVCQDILVRTGSAMGEIAAGVIKRLGMSGIEFNVTLMGGVFYSDNPLFVDEYTTTVHRVAPRARIAVSRQRPDIGAYHLALDMWGKTMRNEENKIG